MQKLLKMSPVTGIVANVGGWESDDFWSFPTRNCSANWLNTWKIFLSRDWRAMRVASGRTSRCPNSSGPRWPVQKLVVKSADLRCVFRAVGRLLEDERVRSTWTLLRPEKNTDEAYERLPRYDLKTIKVKEREGKEKKEKKSTCKQH